MFGKLKDKLKGALSIFSKKTEEEADETTETSQEQITEESKPQKKEESKTKELERPVEKEKAQKQVEEIKEEIKTKAEPTPIQEKVEKPEPIEETKKEPVTKESKEVSEPISAQDLLDNLEQENLKEKKLEEKPEELETKEKTQIQEPTPKPVEIAEKPITKEVKKEESKPTPIQEKPKEETIEIVEDTQEEAPEKTKETIKEETTEPEPKKSFFKKITQTFTTKKISEDKFEELFWDLEVALLENNVSVKVIEKIKEDLKLELVDKPLPRNVLKKIEDTLESSIKNIVNIDPIDLLNLIKQKNDESTEQIYQPFVITFFGINGSGKTTSIAKLTHYLKEQNLKVVLAAGDTFRAAAIQQLEDHANRLETKIIKHDYGSDAAAVAYDSIEYAKKNQINVVLIDTAGRLHSNTNLMQELEKILRIAPADLKIFVGESITGNDCVLQAQEYNKKLGIDGIILTKADIDEQGGAPLSISYVLKKPILFLGMGQEYKDLLPFSPQIILDKLGFSE